MSRTIAGPCHALLIIVIMAIATPALAQDAPPPRPPRPTMTVADFDTDRTGWMPPPNLGQTLAELLTTHLVESGTYRMLDRVWIVSSSENRGRIPFDVLVDRAAGAGVQYVVAGSVTRFSLEKRSSTGGGFVPLPFVGGLVHKDRTESVIGLTLRVIDVTTGEVVITATATSGAEHRDSHGGGIAVVGHVPVFGAKGSSSTGFTDRLLDTAVQQAVADAAEKLLAAAPRLVK
jgi:curli biogenesis system outer membrane secretion channel CsgG